MTGLNALILFMEHPFDNEFQVCSNEVPGFTNGHDIVSEWKWLYVQAT